MKKKDKLNWILDYIRLHGPQTVKSFEVEFRKECKPESDLRTSSRELTVYLSILYRNDCLQRKRKGNPWYYEYSI